ncbi:MAG: anti-sigma factor domain-containing protein [Firmicutes bacterium]|nr:anti-sigma factor domain-containing protein [Candidatus Fermentithermobacillaceae bacterium]
MTSQDSGVVVRAGRGYAVVLTRDGRFLRVRSRGIPPMVGEEIPLASPFAPWASWTRWVPAVALACVMVFLSFFGYTKYIQARPAVAYVSVDSSGSVELEVNDRGLVRSATAFDEKGQELLSLVRYQFQPVDKVIAEMAKIESKKGSSGFIVGFIPIKETPQVTKFEARIREEVRKAASNFPLLPTQTGQSTGGDSGVTNPLVNTFRFTVQMRDKARAMSMSPARLLVWGLSAKSRATAPSGPGPGSPNGTSGGKGQPPKPGDSTQPGKTGPGTGSGQPGTKPGGAVPPGTTGAFSEEQVRTSLPDVSNVRDFLEVLKEHEDPEKLQEVVEEMLDALEEAEKKPAKGEEGTEPGGNETTPGRPDNGSGAGKEDRGKKGNGKGGEQPGKGGKIDDRGRSGYGRAGYSGGSRYGGKSGGGEKSGDAVKGEVKADHGEDGEDGTESGKGGVEKTSGKTALGEDTARGDSGHGEESPDDEPDDR